MQAINSTVFKCFMGLFYGDLQEMVYCQHVACGRYAHWHL